MESRFRPIPVTILDFLAVLLPGFVWLILLYVTAQFLINGDSEFVDSPVSLLNNLTLSKESEASSLPIVVCILVASLIIGYSLKPVAMRIAEMFTIYLFKLHKDYRKVPLKKLKYPFREIYQDTENYKQVCNFINEHFSSSLEELKGHQTFSVAKRYLKLIAPSLWEECERMEAEVRMTGVLFLAAFYSFILSAIILIAKLFGTLQNSPFGNILIWFVVSGFMSLILAEGFNRQRMREVGYTYLNALVAAKFKTSVVPENLEAHE